MKRVWVFLLSFALLSASQGAALGEVRDQDFYPVVDESVDSPQKIIESPDDGFSFEVRNGDGQSFLNTQRDIAAK